MLGNLLKRVRDEVYNPDFINAPGITIIALVVKHQAMVVTGTE